MFTQEDARSLLGATVYGEGEDRIGKAGQIFLDDDTGQPEWVTVNTGLFGTRESFVPLRAAERRGDDALFVPYSKEKVKNAPNVDVEEGHLSPEEESELYRYYEVDAGTDTTYGDTRTGRVEAARDETVSADTERRDVSGAGTDDAMTRSEERMRVGTEQVQTGRARLRKYVTTEEVTQTVPVKRERVTLEREPITDANVGAATEGPEISEAEHEVVLTEERPVVAKETVPVERVRLGKDTEVGEERVAEQLRKEQIDVDDKVDLRDSEAAARDTER